MSDKLVLSERAQVGARFYTLCQFIISDNFLLFRLSYMLYH